MSWFVERMVLAFRFQICSSCFSLCNKNSEMLSQVTNLDICLPFLKSLVEITSFRVLILCIFRPCRPSQIHHTIITSVHVSTVNMVDLWFIFRVRDELLSHKSVHLLEPSFHIRPATYKLITFSVHIAFDRSPPFISLEPASHSALVGYLEQCPRGTSVSIKPDLCHIYHI